MPVDLQGLLKKAGQITDHIEFIPVKQGIAENNNLLSIVSCSIELWKSCVSRRIGRPKDATA